MAEKYRTMNKSDLLDICRERGITGYSKLVKEKVIDLILQHENPPKKKRKVVAKTTSGPEKLILAHTYENQNINGWFMSEKIDGNGNNFKMIGRCIDSVQTADENLSLKDESDEEVQAFLESLTSEQFKVIGAYMEKMPKLEHTLHYECSKCKTKKERKLSGISDFF